MKVGVQKKGGHLAVMLVFTSGICSRVQDLESGLLSRGLGLGVQSLN